MFSLMPCSTPSSLSHLRKSIVGYCIKYNASSLSSSSSPFGINGFSNNIIKSYERNIESNTNEFIKGEVVDVAINLKSIRPGERINIPYELTVTDAMVGFWQSAFHNFERINTSTPFARKVGLQDRIVPFSFVVFLALSMSHADSAKVQVRLENAIYHWPAFVGDTFTKSYQVKSIRNTSDGNHSVIKFACELMNQRNKLCMSVDNYMMFPFTIPESNVEIPTSHPDVKSQLLRDHLLGREKTLTDIGSHSLISFRAGQLIYHTLNRSLSLTQSQQLASLARLTHELHFDVKKYDPFTEILIPGGLVLGAVLSASSRDLHEILLEEIKSVSFLNALHPGNSVTAISYIKDFDDTMLKYTDNLECMHVRTIGIKNIDIPHDLQDMSLPLELFNTDRLLPKDIEKLCKAKCPILRNKIVAIIDRKIIRQASDKKDVFLL